MKKLSRHPIFLVYWMGFIKSIIPYVSLFLYLISQYMFSQQQFLRFYPGNLVNDCSISKGVFWRDYSNNGVLDLLVANWNDLEADHV
jgi:hypothetical protein